MTTDPHNASPSDYQDDRPRPPDRVSDAGYAAPAYPTHALPPLPPYPPAFPPSPVAAAGPAEPASLDPVHPSPEAPRPDEEPYPVRETSYGPGVGIGAGGAGAPAAHGPSPTEPTPVRTPAEKPRSPQADAGGPAGDEMPGEASPETAGTAGADAAPAPARQNAAADLPPYRDADTDTDTEAGFRSEREPTPVRDAIEDPSPLRKETPVPVLSRLPEYDSAPADADPAPATGPADDSAPHDSEQPIHTLLWTAATERPVEEVAALVSRLKRTGEVDSPGDLALRAAAVSRPLEEVRQLVALLNEYPHPLHEADTTLRAAAVGRPIEDVVRLVNMIGTDASEWRSAANEAADDEPRPPAGTGGGRSEATAGPQDAAAPSDRTAKKSPWAVAALTSALSVGPAGHTVSPALRSALRWPAALVLFACGIIHLPTDVAGLRSGGYAQTLSIAVTVLCLVVAVWLTIRDSALVWAGAAGLAIGVIALHALAHLGTMNLLQSSLGDSFTWAAAAAVLCAGASAILAGSVLLRQRQPAPGATNT